MSQSIMAHAGIDTGKHKLDVAVHGARSCGLLGIPLKKGT
jgi:hypothetical protein